MLRVTVTFLRKHLSSGYFLIELTLYCGLLVLLCGLCYSWMATNHLLVARLSSSCSNSASLQAGLALFYRDLHSAPSCCNRWKKYEKTEIVWSTNKGTDIGWKYTKNKLRRTEGIFSPDTQQWGKSVTSTIAAGNIAMQFNIMSVRDTVMGVQVTYATNNHNNHNNYDSGSCFIALRNRNINKY